MERGRWRGEGGEGKVERERGRWRGESGEGRLKERRREVARCGEKEVRE